MTIDYATAGTLLDAFRDAWESRDGEAWVALFEDDVVFQADPFEDALTGHNAVRAYLYDASITQGQSEFTVERHWVSGSTVLAAWHAGFVEGSTGMRVRIAGFMTLEIGSGDRIARVRQWSHQRASAAG